MKSGQPDSDARWMHEAIALARRVEGQTRPNPPVGAVIVRGGKLVGKGYHRRAGGDHAEIHAFRDAGRRASGATLYVTLEPCSTRGRTGPCTEAIKAAGISRVVVGCVDPNPSHRGRGLTKLRRAGIRVDRGILESEAQDLVAPFAKWMRDAKPYVSLKLAITADGRIADRKGSSRWITSAASRNEVQRMRRRVDAILVGSITACRDNPSLTYRGRRRAPLYRVIADSRGSLPLSARLLNDDHVESTIMAVSGHCPKKRQEAYRRKGARVWVSPGSRGRISSPALMRFLAAQEILHVLCEGGGELAEDLLRRKLVDRIRLFVAPKILGGHSSVPAIGGDGWLLSNAPHFNFTDCTKIGPDIMITAEP